MGPTYDDNVLGASGDEAKVSDWSVTLSAGTGVLIPIGKKLYLGGTIFPQYIWYDRLTDRRRWGGQYGGTLYGFFNHLSFEANYQSDLTPVYPNSEIQTQVLGGTYAGTLKTEVDIGGPWSLYAGAEHQQLTYRPLGAPPPDIGLALSLLNRNEGAVRGGLRYKLASYVSFGFGMEGTQTKFPEDPERADNRSTAYLASVYYNQPRLFVNFNGGYRVGRPIDGSEFPGFATFTGSGYVSYALVSHLALDLYGQRGINYSLFENNPYYLETLGGARLNLGIGQRITINAFGGYGTNRYPLPVVDASGSVLRVDKVTSYGGGLSFLILKSISLTANVTNYDYNSNIPAFDRTVLRFTTGLVIGVITP